MATKRDIVIAGYSETPINFKSGRSAYDLGGEALAKLLEATGDREAATTLCRCYPQRGSTKAPHA